MKEIIKNEEYDLEITGMTHEGMGVGKINNFTVFIEGAVLGEFVKIKIIKVNKTYAFGKLIKIITSSDRREKPFCDVYKHCGGCELQHMNYEAQLEFKKNLVEENLKRIGKIEGAVVYETLGMENSLNYRNKVQYPVSIVKGKLQIGFFAKRTHDIVEGEFCEIQSPMGIKIKNVIKNLIQKNKISVYNEKTHAGLIRNIVIRVGINTNEVMVIIVINGFEFPKKGRLIEKLVEAVPEITTVIVNINRNKTNVVLGDKNLVAFGEGTIREKIKDFEFVISPISFFQVNTLQTEVLYDKILEYAELKPTDIVFDLYSGIGTISIYLSKYVKKVYGVEVVRDAVFDAERNARINGIENTEFFEGEVEEILPRLDAEGVRADVVVVDPPRKGCDQKVLEAIVNINPNKMIYVSCNPATLARDLSYLDGHGFKVIKVQPVDMFPHTAHVETVVLMSRKDK